MWIAAGYIELRKKILSDLGIDGDYEGIGHCILGYVDGEEPQCHPRKDNWVYRA